ncbi:MAG: carbon-nitrogen family hydrolase [Lachnospiraceae bacterium]|nr:carbon-nitrogen family hydrolase [Lachnospiraceae bacterium]
MVVGICQTDIVMGDTRYNLIAAEDYIHQCSDKGVELALFPEMSMTGFGLEPESVAEEYGNSVTVHTMTQFAMQYGISIGFGYTAYSDGRYTNRYVVTDKNGRIISDYAKIHPFSYAGENLKYSAGDSVTGFEFGGTVISTFICYDLRFPEIFQAVSDKAEVIVVAANWPASRRDDWKLLLRARALENQSYVIGINRYGRDGELYYSGDSMVVNPKGNVTDILSDRPGIIIEDIDIGAVREYRAGFPVKSDRRPDLYRDLY